MPEDSTPVRRSAMVGWLGFFLLVFAVAGLTFYFTGISSKAPENPASVTRR